MGPVGTVETESSVQGSGLARLQSTSHSIHQDRQEALVRFDSLLNSLVCALLILHPSHFYVIVKQEKCYIFC